MSFADSTAVEHEVSENIQSSTVMIHDACKSSDFRETVVVGVDKTLDEHVVNAQNITACSDSCSDASDLVGNLKTHQNSPKQEIGALLPLVTIKIDLEVKNRMKLLTKIKLI